MRKHRVFFQFEKEEAWLNEMALSGWSFTGRTFWGTYLFQNAEPKKMNVRIDYRLFNRSSDFSEYLQLFADSGWYHICGTQNSGNQYFAPISVDASEDIFSDGASKAGRYRRMGEMWVSILISYTLIFYSCIVNGLVDPSVLLNPKGLYLTPGLWEMSGFRFLRAFLFETPFALGRGLFWLIELAGIGFSLYYIIRAYYAGRKTNEKE